MLFVCYSSLDAERVLLMAEDLRDMRQAVWIDEELSGAQPWWDVILEKIRDCSVFVFALSENSVRSKPCLAELAYARSLGLPVLPVQIAPVAGPRMLPVADLQIVPYEERSASSAIELMKALQDGAQSRRPLPDPLPVPPEIPYAYLAGVATALAKQSLSYSEQSMLFDQLEHGLDEEDISVRQDVLHLLYRFRRRGDITERHAKRIDTVLAGFDGGSTVRHGGGGWGGAHGTTDRPAPPTKPGTWAPTPPITRPTQAQAQAQPQTAPLPNPPTTVDPQAGPASGSRWPLPTAPPNADLQRSTAGGSTGGGTGGGNDPGRRGKPAIWIASATVAIVAVTIAIVMASASPNTQSTPSPSPSPTSSPPPPPTSPPSTSPPTAVDPHSDPISGDTLVVAREVNGVADLFLVNSVTGQVGQQVTVDGGPHPAPHDPAWPAISADRRSIIYVVTESASQGSIRVMAADGTGDRELFTTETGCTRYLPPAWAPAQDRLGLACLTADGRFSMRIVRLDGTTIREFPINDAWVDDLTFSPDGRTLAYFSGDRGSPGGSIFTVAVAGDSAPVDLTHSDTDRSPVWSPDGKEIAFRSTKTGQAGHTISVISQDGSNRRTLGGTGADDIDPSWSPDGKTIVFRSNRDQDDPSIYRYLLMDSDGGNIRPLSPDDDAPAVSAPAWSRR